MTGSWREITPYFITHFWIKIYAFYLKYYHLFFSFFSLLFFFFTNWRPIILVLLSFCGPWTGDWPLTGVRFHKVCLEA